MKIKTKIEILLTGACLYGVYALLSGGHFHALVKTGENKIAAEAGIIAKHEGGLSQEQLVNEAMSDADKAYENAAYITDIKSLEIIARQQADEMVRSGDTDRFSKNMQKNKILKRIILE